MLDRGEQPFFFCRLLEAGSIEKEASCILTLERTGFLRSYKANFHIAQKIIAKYVKKIGYFKTNQNAQNCKTLSLFAVFRKNTRRHGVNHETKSKFIH